MGSKNRPGAFDCWAKAEPDEPVFVLLGRDRAAATTIYDWVDHRIGLGLNERTDPQIREAIHCAAAMRNYALWRAAARPTVVCLIGSTRFFDAFTAANYRETMGGHIVLSIGFAPESGPHGEGVGCTPEQKQALDELHKRKIEMADEVLVLNVGGYIGDSTRSELEHARKLGKTIRWLEPASAEHADVELEAQLSTIAKNTLSTIARDAVALRGERWDELKRRGDAEKGAVPKK